MKTENTEFEKKCQQISKGFSVFISPLISLSELG